jgi:hypothetical protein
MIRFNQHTENVAFATAHPPEGATHIRIAFLDANGSELESDVIPAPEKKTQRLEMRVDHPTLSLRSGISTEEPGSYPGF